MTKEEFKKLATETEKTFTENMSAWHQDKAPSWQFLIQLNTNLPFEDMPSYKLPIGINEMEDSEEKIRSIILWRISQRNVSVDTIKFVAEKIDEIRNRLQEGSQV